MGIALEPLEGFVADVGRDCQCVPSPLEQTGGDFVPEIVKADIHQKARIRLPSRRKALPLAGRPGSPRRPTEGLSHGIRGMFQTLSPSRRSRRDSRILTASRERETTRLSPFFVSTRVTVLFERSTFPPSHFGDLIPAHGRFQCKPEKLLENG